MTTHIDACRFSAAFAAALGISPSPETGPAALVGLEHEYRLLRDARPFDGVRAEVLRRAGGNDEEPTKQAEVASAAQSEQQRGHQS